MASYQGNQFGHVSCNIPNMYIHGLSHLGHVGKELFLVLCYVHVQHHLGMLKLFSALILIQLECNATATAV